MQLDRISIALRAREPWEAVDLGTAMLRAWWRPVYGALLAVMLPLAVGLHLLLEHPWAALLAIWWLKPLYDRIVLHVYARAVFGSTPNVRDTLSHLGTLLWQTGLVGALTWRRLEIARSFNLAVRQLEGQAGGEARERERLLGRRNAGQASGLLYTCLMFEMVVAWSLITGVDLVIPASLDTDWGAQTLLGYWMGRDVPASVLYLNNAFLVTAMFLVEPLYVAGGFALYLNRRTQLEAWDLELAFRRIREREATGLRRVAAMALCAVLVGAAAWLPHEAHAAAASSREIIREVLAAPEFQAYRTEKVWQRREQEAEPPIDSSAPPRFDGILRWLHALSESLAQLLQFAAYPLLAMLVFFLVRILWKGTRGPGGPKPPASGPPPPDVLFGLDVRPESLPADLAQLAAASAGTDPRHALSLLYRGALATLIHRDRVPLDQGDTEGDCVRRVQRSSPHALAAYFARLVAAWSQSAYGGRAPQAGQIDTLCAEWPHHFGAAGKPG